MFKTKDGKYLTLAASTQSVWLRLAEAIGRKDMTTDPKFIDNSARVENSVECNGIVGAWIEQHTRDEVIEHFDKHGVAYSAVFDMEDAFRDIQYRAREAMVRVPDPISAKRSSKMSCRNFPRRPVGGFPRPQIGRRQRSDLLRRAGTF
jgi:formyl-CoA transferase